MAAMPYDPTYLVWASTSSASLGTGLHTHTHTHDWIRRCCLHDELALLASLHIVQNTIAPTFFLALFLSASIATVKLVYFGVQRVKVLG